MGKKSLMSWTALAVILAFAAFLSFGAAPAHAQDAPVQEGPQIESGAGSQPVRWDIAIAIAAAIGLPCLAAGYAVGKVGAAALGAASERPELITQALLFVALGEGIAVFGVVVALLVLLVKF